jgi:hypothetical protein
LSEYKRFVSYIYAYDKGIKNKNVGFAKVESRNGQCRLFINLKGAYAGNGKEQKVYLFRRNGEQLLGTYIGSFVIKNGMGEFRDVSDSSNIKSSGYNLNQMGGILIQSSEQSGQVYASGWDDHGLSVEKFTLGEKDSAENQVISAASIIKFPEKEKTSSPSILDVVDLKGKEETVVIQDLALQAPIIQKKENRRERQIPFVQEQKRESKLPLGRTEIYTEMRGNMQKREEKKIEREVVEVEKQMEIAGREMEWNGEEIQESLEDTKLQEISRVQLEEEGGEIQESLGKTMLKAEEKVKEEKLKTQEARGEKLWERLMNEFPKVIAFEDEPDIMCLKIDLKDLENLPKENWVLGNNSFLLHGYYNFRYLLLARLKENEYILGIPGMYHNKEQFMASMFGFDSFKTVIPCKQKTGQFGYWYQRVRL